MIGTVLPGDLTEKRISTIMASFDLGAINTCPNQPFGDRGSKERILGCCYTTLVLSTCIELKDHLVISVGALRSA